MELEISCSVEQERVGSSTHGKQRMICISLMKVTCRQRGILE